MAQVYKVAGITLELSNCIVTPEWELFRMESYQKRPLDFRIYVISGNNIIHGMEYYYLVNKMEHITRVGTEVMLADKNWIHIVLLPPSEWKIITSFFLQVFYTHAIRKKMLQIHSALIQYKRQGILFLGPSGIGKTTQAELWYHYRNASIINGDISFVQETQDAFLGWGTPWHGSSPYCENTNVPVLAMIVLKQSPENSIRELIGFEKVTAVSQSVFYPRWLENGMELCLETLDHLLTALPVYELSCRPDEDAVRLTEEKIFGNL